MWILKETLSWGNGKTLTTYLRIPGVSDSDPRDPNVKRFATKGAASRYAQTHGLNGYKPVRRPSAE